MGSWLVATRPRRQDRATQTAWRSAVLYQLKNRPPSGEGGFQRSTGARTLHTVRAPVGDGFCPFLAS